MSALFSPITVKGITFRDRIVMPPMVMAGWPTMKEHVDPGGFVTGALIEHYGARADAGVGMIIVEATAVAEDGRVWRGGLHAFSDEFLPGLMQLATRIREGGAVAAIQLVHGGQASPADLLGHSPLGPSTLTAEDGGMLVRGLTAEELPRIQEAFVDAAVRVVNAGFDAVEVHGAHGFLLDRFLSSRFNTRTDAYGGDMAGRMRMLLDTCLRVRAAIGEKLLICRISPFTHRDEGLTQEELGVLVHGLKTAGVDILDVSTDGAFRDVFAPGLTMGQEVKALTDLPIIVAGGIETAEDAERLIADHHADFAAVGKALLNIPDWVQQARERLHSGQG